MLFRSNIYHVLATYRCDFVYNTQGTACFPPGAVGPHQALPGTVFEDVKGYRTAMYRLKKKLVEAEYGITITET